MANNFTIEGRMKSLPDIQRSYNFELTFPELPNIVKSLSSDEPFILRAKSASIPDRSNSPIESYFMGMVQYFPGRLSLGSTLNVNFQEHEDQVSTKALYEWQNILFNIKAEDDDAGHALAESKRNGLSTNIFLKMYKYNGELMENMIRFVNAWPSSVGETGLDMASNDGLFRTVTFQFDYWDLVKA